MKKPRKIIVGGRLCWGRSARGAVFFLFGGVGYGMIEVLWRGHTHPSMVFAGGVCFSAIEWINRRLRGRPLLLRCALSAGAITAVEFSVGLVVNRLLRLSVWDYSSYRLNLLGQICPLYTVLWFLLCVPVLGILSFSMKKTEKKG